MIKQIERMSKTLKAEAFTAINRTIEGKLDESRWIVSSDLRTITDSEDEDGGFYAILYFRNGEEVIAVPDFYINEGNVPFAGSKGGEYELNDETLTVA